MMLTIKEAARLYKVSIPTIYRWIQQDKITKQVQLGVVYYSVDALQKAYESRHKFD